MHCCDCGFDHVIGCLFYCLCCKFGCFGVVLTFKGELCYDLLLQCGNFLRVELENYITNCVNLESLYCLWELHLAHIFLVHVIGHCLYNATFWVK